MTRAGMPLARPHPDLPRAIAHATSMLLLALTLPAQANSFDIDRYSNAGEGRFETFHVKQVQPLYAMLDAGVVGADTQLLVTQTKSGAVALLKDQMSFHHIAQGSADGKDWMATF